MSRTRPRGIALGRCPDCRAEIARGDALIEYERETGESAVWAECPGCRAVVHPEA